MSVENSQEKEWRRLKEQYLKQIEDVLLDSGRQDVDGIVNDVRSHLDRRFAELQPQQQTWENFQKIITEMGPPSDYAELAGEKQGAVRNKVSARYIAILAGVLILLTAGLILLPVLLPKRPLPTWTDTMRSAFVTEPELVGKWVSVDFVSDVNEFSPGSRQWNGDLFLKDVVFNPDGTTNKTWTWTKGWLVHGDGRTKAEYKIVETDDLKYLFLPWLSGDVAIRGMKPKYYVLKKVSDGQQGGEQDNQQAINAAIETAESWLQLIDEGKYSESWAQAAEYFKKYVSEDQWKTSLEAARKPLGKMLSRKVMNSTYTTQAPGAPDGQYVIIQFNTSFENKASALETVTPMMDSDGRWRVSGYYIK